VPNAPSENELRALYSDYGAPPRKLFSSARCPYFYIVTVQQELDKVSPEMARKLLQDPDIDRDAFDVLVLIEPSPASRFIGKRRIATDHVFELLSQKSSTRPTTRSTSLRASVVHIQVRHVLKRISSRIPAMH
jgi:hypothetical protein